MKAYARAKGKNWYYTFWGDYKSKNLRQKLKQSARKISKDIIKEGIQDYNTRYDEIDEEEIEVIWSDLTGWDDW